MKDNNLKITVIDCNFTIPDETVERCLKIIEYWLNDNPDKCISGGIRHKDGKIEGFKIEDRKK